MSNDIELTASEAGKIYGFALSRVAQILLSANTGSEVYEKAVKVFKSKSKKDLLAFINYYNKLKTKPV